MKHLPSTVYELLHSLLVHILMIYFFLPDGNTLTPVISISPASRKVLKGDNVSLACEAVSTKDSETQFSWKKDNVVCIKLSVYVENYDMDIYSFI